MSDRLLKESDVLKIAFQLPLIVNSAFADAVKAVPPADRLQGEWAVKPGSKDEFRCSRCGKIIYADCSSERNYCPNCGSKNKINYLLNWDDMPLKEENDVDSY